ncbi:MAG: hypothetical protein ACRDG8_08620 [Actinomycetota bacterium]
MLPAIVAFLIGFFLATTARADHENEGSCKGGADYYLQQSAVREDGQVARDGVRADITRMANPTPIPKTAVIRSIYLFKSNGIDMVEFGWHWTGDLGFTPPGVVTADSPVAFAARQIGGQHVVSEGDPSNPGHGWVPEGARTFRISRNVPGGEPSTYFFYRDGQYFGKFYNPNLNTGGQPTGAAEAKGPCDTMWSTFEALDRQANINGSWADWNNAFRFADANTKWFYSDKTDNPPQWYLRHCANAWCPNV